ncbi:ectoine/hydroxyectoine ABC transporter substrate-binding protein EhuB [Halomonas sp. 1390]|uniref:ectoine/hydroxyectoine ABC transporter substrate-binding protein EhuB n=1 Tax=Halomonas sp. B23F22_3 TaxID=3459516 RepID=UPI00373E4595
MKTDTLLPQGSALMAGTLAVLLAAPSLQAATLEEIQQRELIRIAVANERPYGYLNDQGKALGVGPEVATRILHELGIPEIEWVEAEFQDLIPGLESGRFDMAAAEMAILPERCERVLFSNPNTSYGEGLLVMSSNPHRIRSYEDFIQRAEEIRVAFQPGTVQEAMFEALGIDPVRIVEVASPQHGLEVVVRGEADAYAATGMTVAAMEQMSPEVEAEFNFEDPVIDGREVRYFGGFAFPLDADDLRDAVNEALREEKRDGDWQQTLTRYGFLRKDVLYSFRFTAEELCNGAG